MSTQIRYKGKPVTTFERGTVTLKTEDFGLEGDIEVTSEGGSGGGETVPEWDITDHTITKGGN